MPADVLEEHPFGPALHDDPADVRPEVPGVATAEALAGGRERLARIARSDDVHASTPASAVEGGKVVPDRSMIQGLIRHPGHEAGRGEGFPLDVTHSASPGFRESEADLQSASAGAEREDVDVVGRRWAGMCSHVMPPASLPLARRPRAMSRRVA